MSEKEYVQLDEGITSKRTAACGGSRVGFHQAAVGLEFFQLGRKITRTLSFLFPLFLS